MTELTTRAPALSVVIASVNGWYVLEATLDALDALPERDDIEVVVVEAVGPAVRERLRARDRSVVVLESPRRARSLISVIGRSIRARGELVAILEDHAQVEPGWASALLRQHEGPWGAVGGPVENGVPGLSSTGRCSSASTRPYRRAPVRRFKPDLPGNNIAYKRPHLLRHARLLDEGKWESWINDRLRADGVPIASTNAMVVKHIKPFGLRYFLTQRFHFGRSYAGMRRADQSWAKRLAYGLGSLILPGLLSARVARTVVSKRRNLGRFAMAAPLVGLFLTVGAMGEMTGYLIGPGASLDNVE